MTISLLESDITIFDIHVTKIGVINADLALKVPRL